MFIVFITGCDVISHEKTCFSYFTSTGVNWTQARQNCLSRSYDLATVTSVEENTLLYDNLIAGKNCWIGLNDIDNEGTFVWADNSNSTYRHWLYGQLNDGEDTQNCVESSQNGFWNRSVCDSINSCYVCSTTGKSYVFK